MILNRTGLLKLDYDEKNDILRISWPDLQLAPDAEILHSVKLLTDAIVQYDIKRLLIDSRTTVSDLDEDTYRKVLGHLIRDFATTRLQKIARLASSDFSREDRVHKVAGELSQQSPLAINFKSFGTGTEAVAWLQQ